MKRVKTTPEMRAGAVQAYIAGQQVVTIAKQLGVSRPAVYMYCVPWMKVAHARIREMEAQLAESEQHRAKNRETAVALQDEVTDLRMKLGFRDAHIESLQNKWASRPLSSEDQAKRIAALEAALRGVLPKFWASDNADEAVYQNAKALLAQSETPEAMHARIVTETADAIASQMETFGVKT